MAMSKNSLLVARDVYKQCPGVQTLPGVSFTVFTGQIEGLVETNGSGKSTLSKVAAGLLRSSRGEVGILGQVPRRRTKAQVAFMPEMDHLYPRITVQQTLDFVSNFSGSDGLPTVGNLGQCRCGVGHVTGCSVDIAGSPWVLEHEAEP